MRLVFTITGRCQFYVAEDGELWREVSADAATDLMEHGVPVEYR